MTSHRNHASATSLGLNRTSSKMHQQFSRKRSHSPNMPRSVSPHRKMHRDLDFDKDRYLDSQKGIYENKRNLSTGRKSHGSSDLHYKGYASSQGSGLNRGGHSYSHEQRRPKSRERPMDNELPVESHKPRFEDPPLYSKDVPKRYGMIDSEKKYYGKNYETSHRPRDDSFNEPYMVKEKRIRERSLSPPGHYTSRGKGMAHASPTKLSFSREDLEKITVDIRRNVKDPSPTRRAIIRPEEVKIVRRTNEGVQPLFNREEIRNPAVDLREDALLERRVISVKPTVEERDVGRIRAHRDKSPNRNVDLLPYSDVSANPSMTLSQRWQSYDSRKAVSRLHPSERDGYRERSLEKLSPRRSSVSPTRVSRDRFQDISYIDEPLDSSARRKEFTSYRGDGRKKYSTTNERKDGYTMRKEGPFYKSNRLSNNRSYEGSDRVDRGRDDLGRSLDKGRSLSREREKSNPRKFSDRPDRFKSNDRLEKTENSFKRSNYYEIDKNQDDRAGRSFQPRYRGRGFNRGTRGFIRGFRARGRGNFRGRNYRGSFHDSSKRTKSPSHWEHDLFNKMSPGKVDDVNPSSTT